MAYDGLTNYFIANELKSHLIDGKIDKIFQPNSSEILLGVYSNFKKYGLDIVTSSNHYRACITNNAKPNPMYAPNFCMVLRKYILNTRITNIYTYGLERIIVLEFEGNCKADDISTKKLILELMGKHSNIILVNSNNVIIDALKHFSIENNSYRNILPNALYTLPISNKLDFMQISNSKEFYNKTTDYIQHELDTIIDKNMTASKALSNVYTGFSKNTISSILNELNLADTFDKNTLSKIYNYIYELIQNQNKAVIVHNSNDYSISLSDDSKNDSLQINDFIDNYYIEKEKTEEFTNYRDNLSRLILGYLKRLNNKLLNINNKLQECRNTDLYRIYGELITNNLYLIKNEHSDKLEIENYYDNNNLVSIPLDKALTPSANAKKYFKKYNKLKNAKQIVEEQKAQVESELNYLESIIYEIEIATSVSDIDNIYNEFTENFNTNSNRQVQSSKKKKNKKPDKKIAKIGTPLECTVDGFKVIVGRNNKQNDYITKQALDTDLWFHTKDVHGSHVILKTENKVPTQNTINKVASITAFYSKGAQSSNVSVDYAYAKYVKKPSKAKPGMVIYTNNKNVIVKPANDIDNEKNKET